MTVCMTVFVLSWVVTIAWKPTNSCVVLKPTKAVLYHLYISFYKKGNYYRHFYRNVTAFTQTSTFNKSLDWIARIKNVQKKTIQRVKLHVLFFNKLPFFFNFLFSRRCNTSNNIKVNCILKKVLSHYEDTHRKDNEYTKQKKRRKILFHHRIIIAIKEFAECKTYTLFFGWAHQTIMPFFFHYPLFVLKYADVELA